MIEVMEKMIERAQKSGASYADVRYQTAESSIITIENGLLKSYETSKLAGIGVRVIVYNALGLASSTILELPILNEKVDRAIGMAKVAKKRTETTSLAKTQVLKDSAKSPFTKDPNSVPHEEKIAIALDANKASRVGEIKNLATRLGMFHEHRLFMSSEGAEIKTETVMTGLSHQSVATHNGTMEYVADRKSKCAGFEFITSMDWCAFTKDVSDLAIQVAKAKTPSAGVYRVVADSELIGLILHEALGHASEGDGVITKESVLEGRLGTVIASPSVTIVDEGVVEDGYFLPYDDEGVKKVRQTVVEKGTLKGYLHSRDTAQRMSSVPTGNARAQNYGSLPIVRQTNFYMEKGDHELEELTEDINDGLYICGRGARGGEVDVGLGAFTFRCGPSYVIKKGEIKEMVRGISISGMILETMKQISAIGKDFKITTGIFGGCGKDGQIARVGEGGPHVKIDKISVGGG